MQRVFVSLIAGAPNIDDKVLTVVCALMDFIYYAQFQLHTSKTLDAMQSCLDTFHLYRDVFIELGLCEDFDIPKFHAMQHDIAAIRALGGADRYKTEFLERLHIDYAKEGYRASNKRDYIEQMALWLQHQEAIDSHSAYLLWTHKNIESLHPPTDSDFDDNDHPSDSEDNDNDDDDIVPDNNGPMYHMAKKCPLPHLSITRLENDFGAIDFLPALTTFLKENTPSRTSIQPSPTDRFDVYCQINLNLPPNSYLSSQPLTARICTTPAIPPKGCKTGTPAHFDTALIVDHQKDGTSGECEVC